MTQTTLTPAAGMTCTHGSGKTIWEIVHIDYDESGAPKQLHMSKAGGDGYTNRWATPNEIRNLTAPALKTSLGDVLNARTESAPRGNGAGRGHQAPHETPQARNPHPESK